MKIQPKGDPHIMKWNGGKYDFHGECDLVLFQAPDYAKGLGLDVHIRTTIQDWFSYVEEVAVKAGNFVVNVNKDGFWFDNHLVSIFPAQEDHFRVERWENRNEKTGSTTLIYDIWVKGTKILTVRVPHSKYIFVVFRGLGSHNKFFGNPDDDIHTSGGLMGEFTTGRTVGRDGITEFEDMEEFGKDWQVQPHEDMLFLTSRAPQLPDQACVMPTKKSNTDRKLSANPGLRKMAEAACEHVDSTLFRECVDDVIATKDVEIAAGY